MAAAPPPNAHIKKSRAVEMRPAMDDLPSKEGLPSHEGRQTAFDYGSLITSQSKPTEAVPAWKDDAETPTWPSSK